MCVCVCVCGRRGEEVSNGALVAISTMYVSSCVYSRVQWVNFMKALEMSFLRNGRHDRLHCII